MCGQRRFRCVPFRTRDYSIDVDGKLTKHIVVACLLDTGCLSANLNKEDIARRLGTSTQSADRQRLITLADGFIASSVGYVMCDVTLKHDEISVELKDVKLHILPSLWFDVIIGFPCIRKKS